ncbi:o-succinylbenzoate synthase [Aquipuribacter sp. MA13-6]|uniref:o-succinylbenzoate synthase n=1 Tax=unclassified Aquipuribacter TaxID=2635084 RepID=UPI003EEB8EAF
MPDPTTPDLPDPDRVHVVSLPLRTRFRGVGVREVLLVDGPAGWGEFAPFVEYDDHESARWLAACLEAAHHGWPAPLRATVEVNATVPAVAAADVAAVLARFPGCTTAKVKVAERGQTLADDLDRVAAVRAVLGADAAIRVDANGAWDLDQAVDALTALAAYRLDYAEQPVAEVADLARLRVRLAAAGLDVPVAADESVRRAEDPFAVALAGAADVVVVKVAPLGGVRRLLEVAEVLQARHGVGLTVSSALDSSVGLAAGVAAAAALPGAPRAAGLGTAALLAADVTTAPLLPVDGQVRVGPVVPDPDLLARHAVPPPRQQWWRERLTRCHAVLRGAGDDARVGERA